jgi:hypothetical protein
MQIKVYDNFLDQNYFFGIKELLTGDNFPWYLNQYNVNVNKKEFSDPLDLKNFQFVHMFYNDFSIQSSFFQNISPLINQMNVSSLIRIKSNLKTKWDKVEEFSPHVDNKINNSRTAIFYINDNDGYTKFVENNKKIDSVSNRLVTFPTNLLHAGSTHTNAKYRIVININYFGEI